MPRARGPWAPSLTNTVHCTGRSYYRWDVPPGSYHPQTGWQVFGDRWLSPAVLWIRRRRGWEAGRGDSHPAACWDRASSLLLGGIPKVGGE